MAVDWTTGKKVTIQEALLISKSNPKAEVYYRPEQNLPEAEQYALVVEE